jgi:quercetin dioxygenase-like cupin family protein
VALLAFRRVSEPIARGRGEGATVRNRVGGTVTYKATAEETDGVLTALESVVAPGEGPPLHVHPHHDELLYALEGSLRFRLGTEVSDAPAGTFVFVPRGLPHTWQNAGETPARLFVAFAPAAPGMESFFRSSAVVDDDVALTEVFRGVASGGEMEILGPPLARLS